MHCVPDIGRAAKRAGLQSWNSIPDMTFPCLSQRSVTRGDNWVPEWSFCSLLPFAVLLISLTREIIGEYQVISVLLRIPLFLTSPPAS